MKLYIITLFLFCVFTAPLYAQHAPQAFGKIDKADLEMTHNPFYIPDDYPPLRQFVIKKK